MVRLTYTLAAAALLGVAAPVSAQTPEPQAAPSSLDQEARTLFDAGSLAYGEGRHANALDYFRRAYELSHRPGLLYNIAVTAERLRRDEEALEAYREFLVQVPGTEQRAVVEARIAILEVAVGGDTQDAAPSSADSGASADIEADIEVLPRPLVPADLIGAQR